MNTFLKLLLLLSTNYATSVVSWDFAVTIKNKILFYDENWSLITSAAHQFEELSAITFDETEELIYFNDQNHQNGSIFTLKLSLNEDSGGGSSGSGGGGSNIVGDQITTINNNQHHITENILARTKNETITGMAFDPLERILYWTDSLNRKIYKLSVDRNDMKMKKPQILFDFSQEDSIPAGIAIDKCRRKLYWTNSNHKMPTIERSFLNGTKREIIIDTNLYLPHGITIDQYSDRIYWVVDQQGSHYSVESSNLDGSDRQIIVHDLYNVPFNLAVTKNSIYWTDLTHKAIWNVTKHARIYQKNNDDGNGSNNNSSNINENVNIERPNKIHAYPTTPKGIIAREHFLSRMENDVNCKDLVKTIKKRLRSETMAAAKIGNASQKLSSSSSSSNTGTTEEKLQHHRKELFCLNRGEYNSRSGACICKMGYTGTRCEINQCHNFCVHGTCRISSEGYPECTCQEGFHGERCEIHQCTNYCMNNGKCELKSNNGTPICHCSIMYTGKRCEQNMTEICSLFCDIRKYEPDRDIPFGCYDICDEYPDIPNYNVIQDQQQHSSSSPSLTPNSYHHSSTMKSSKTDNNDNDTIPMCSNVYSKTVIFIIVGVLTALLLVFLIIQALRRIYKPARPRIKKTFVVQKKVSQTPLTSRPLATEQCEITIENCCNMNICDTPCFDPKLLQQNMSFVDKNNTKEDKKILINNMEDDLY